MDVFRTNKDLISRGVKEFNVLLSQQVFNEPLVSDEDMEIMVGDWVKLYLNYYRKHMTGEQQQQDSALQELQQELNTLSNHFLAKYRVFLESHGPSDCAVPSL
uniref:alpha-hemoglobin-stabilizing protein n=1 Tax=Jaculus jaculus TaxID=51337 RepID=UPI001E1B3EF4|nr:alpha-hemoglobin-stabilizing protein [Jaculus jaculus]XP_044987553.1 alpha-hemoglobin-stabilizing protein [Jaculus jaculus]